MLNLVGVMASKKVRGFRGTWDGIKKQSICVCELRVALTDTYKTDAHLVSYFTHPPRRYMPRINKPGLQHVDTPILTNVFFCDADNPTHKPWDDTLFNQAMELYQKLDILKTAGVYHTEHGCRIVQPLNPCIEVQKVEPYIKQWLAKLEAAGIPVDWACKDWNRLFRLPNVVREGKTYVSPYLNLENMEPIDIEPIAIVQNAWEGEDKGQNHSPEPSSPPKAPPNISWTEDVPEALREKIVRLAQAVRAVESEWHTLFLAIAGAFLSRGTDPGQVPALCRAISIATGKDEKTESRVSSARSSVERYCRGEKLTGYSRLRENWPEVAQVFNDEFPVVLPEVTAEDLEFARKLKESPELFSPEPSAASPSKNSKKQQKEQSSTSSSDDGWLDTHTLVQNLRALSDCIHAAPDGLSLISAEHSFEPVDTALSVAYERSQKQYESPDAQSKRAPAYSKTGIASLHNLLAKLNHFWIQMMRGTAKRFFGPLSLKDRNGSYVCQCYQVAVPLVQGGQHMQWELCKGRGIEPCEHFDSCPAKDGFEGDPDARIALGSQRLLSVLGDEIGETGVMVIDRPPELLETVDISSQDIKTTKENLDAFDSDYVKAMRPILDGVDLWMHAMGTPGDVTTIPQIIRGLSDHLYMFYKHDSVFPIDISVDLVDRAKNVEFPTRHGVAPPIWYPELARARREPAFSIKLGTASRVLGALYHAISSEIQVAAQLEKQKNSKTACVKLTRVRDYLYQGFRRKGPVVILDPAAQCNLPIYAKIVGYDPPLHVFPTWDAAPIERTYIRSNNLSKRKLFRNSKLALTPSLLRAVEAVFQWAKECEIQTLGIVTFPTIECIFKMIQTPDDPALRESWANMGQDPKFLDAAIQIFSPIMKIWNGQLHVTHFGSPDLSESKVDLDGVATLGDPWPSIKSVESTMAFLGTPEGKVDRFRALCRSRLAEAHGWLHAAARTSPGWALHIGRMLPGNVYWERGKVIKKGPLRGRPKNDVVLDLEELKKIVEKHGGIRATARKIGISRQTVLKVLQGKALSQEMAEKFRTLMSEQNAEPVCATSS